MLEKETFQLLAIKTLTAYRKTFFEAHVKILTHKYEN